MDDTANVTGEFWPSRIDHFVTEEEEEVQLLSRGLLP